jgi:phage antirepressor YoqD-like protein
MNQHLAVMHQGSNVGGINIGETHIRQDEEGRYCLNDLHRAAGGMSKDRPSFFLRTNQARELVREIQCANPHSAPTMTLNGGTSPGTFVCKELVYAYAMWISPQFNLKVIRAFDALAAGKVQVVQPQQHHHVIPQTFSEALRLAADERDRADKLALEIKTQADVIVEQAPKVEAFDLIAESAGYVGIRQAALTLEIPQNKFVTWLIEDLRWIHRAQNGNLCTYKPTFDKGYAKTKYYWSDAANAFLPGQVLISSKGMTALARLKPTYFNAPSIRY